MSYFVYLNDGGWIVSQFEIEADADDLIAANDTGVMAKIVAPSNSDTVKYLNYVDGNFVAETQANIDAENLIQFREERNKLLADTDWTQVNDSPLSDGKKIEWQTYRQALRDMPSQDGFDPLNPTYPSEPS
tara:strand:+ start:312 stop:704 length:393 start_codon:yes stop_codon:yes gene_type:complete